VIKTLERVSKHYYYIIRGIECIGRHAFSNTSIKRLSFPDGLKTIGSSAFENVLWSTIQNIKETLIY